MDTDIIQQKLPFVKGERRKTMLKRFRPLGSVPVFPSVLAAGALLLGLPWLKILLLGLLAIGLTGLCALFLCPKKDSAVPSGWNRNLRNLKRDLDRIKNRTVSRSGEEIFSELKRCRGDFPHLSPAERREITEYYLPTFLKYFSAYATFEECNEGNPSVLATMEQMETSLGQISDGFRAVCDRNSRATALHLRAEASLLSKKLSEGGNDIVRQSSEHRRYQ